MHSRRQTLKMDREASRPAQPMQAWQDSSLLAVRNQSSRLAADCDPHQEKVRRKPGASVLNRKGLAATAPCRDCLAKLFK